MKHILVTPVSSLAIPIAAILSKVSIILLSLFSLQGCAMRILDWATPSKGYQLSSDISYGEHPRQQLDRYDANIPNKNNIAIVFFYGGAWEGGDKEDYRFVAQALAAEGYSVFIPNYRVHPDGLFPEFMADAADALQWARQNTTQHIVVMGHSAGAHIAALLVLNKQYTARAESNSSKALASVEGLIGLSGPYDFLPLKSERLKIIFAAADELNHTQPINYVTTEAPPALLIHGKDDTVVKPFNSKRLAKKLEKNGVNVTLILYPDAGHAVTVGALSVPFRKQLPILSDITAFLNGLSTQDQQ